MTLTTRQQEMPNLLMQCQQAEKSLLTTCQQGLAENAQIALLAQNPLLTTRHRL